MYLLYTENECSSNSVIFVIDTSFSIGPSRFQLIREFTASITSVLIRNSPRNAVGVILFGNIAYIQFNLQTYTTLNELLYAIDRLPYDGGTTNTAAALNLLLSSARRGTLGIRDDSSSVAIVISDGESNNQSATLSAAASLHASNLFDVYAVGVDGANLTELEGIASNPEFVFYTSSFDYMALQQLQDRIISHLCNSK